MAAQRAHVLLSPSLTLRTSTCFRCQIRRLHKSNAPILHVPRPTPFVPDAKTFLTLIGRKMSAHVAKIPSWEALFTLSSAQLRESGVEPARARRYLLWWRDRFRHGIMGIGGDLAQVKDGIAELRIVEVSGGQSSATVSQDAGMRKIVVNVPPTVVMPPDPANPNAKTDSKTVGVMAALAPLTKMSEEEAVPVKGMHVVQGTRIGGTGVEYIKGLQGVARLRVAEGLWEQRRGHKGDGGERRKAEVRAKRRAAERKNAR